jgi:hypothetical protein
MVNVLGVFMYFRSRGRSRNMVVVAEAVAGRFIITTRGFKCLAQLVEQLAFNQMVASSSLAALN